MKRFIYIILFACAICAGFSACSSNDDDEAAVEAQNAALVGRWNITQWNRNGTFVNITDAGYFQFYASGAYVYYDAVNDDMVTGQYTWNRATQRIHCERTNGYSFTIQAAFDDADNATFSWWYDATGESTATIVKVKRTGT